MLCEARREDAGNGEVEDGHETAVQVEDELLGLDVAVGED
jgi:hypothetical protein